MGKKKQRQRKANREKKLFGKGGTIEEDDFEQRMLNADVKKRSKLSKKLMKKIRKMQETEKQEMKHDPLLKRCGFHMVTVYLKDDVKIDKIFLLTSIGNYVDVPFCPLGYFRGTESITFYFDGNNDIAEAIQALNKRIPSPSGELMGIKVTFVEKTDVILNCDQLELLKNVIAQRFIVSSGLLDLSALHFDQQFLETNTFVPLCDDRILKQVLIIIRDHMPNVSALNLSNNKLNTSSLKLFETLDFRCPSLFALNLENNNIKHIHILKCLRSLPLKELKLSGNNLNPFPKASFHKYIRVVRKELPFLKVLDGQDVTSIKMEADLLQPENLIKQHPSPLAAIINQVPQQPSVLVGEDKLKTFLEQYYSLLDSPKKETLSQAYIPTAKIELKSQNSLIPSSSFEGLQQIADFLQSWPATKHDHASFNLEILSLSPTEGITKVSGVCLFEEAKLSLSFVRIMKIVPFNSGLCCAEDLLEIL